MKSVARSIKQWRSLGAIFYFAHALDGHLDLLKADSIVIIKLINLAVNKINLQQTMSSTYRIGWNAFNQYNVHDAIQ